MQVWAVVYDPASFTNDLYHKALSLLDQESQVRIKKFYHREDACRTLIGRLLVRVMLAKRGISSKQLNFSVTAEGKPYITSSSVDPPIAYNITHDNNLIAMGFGPGVLNPPAFSIGIDIMKLKVPGRETLTSFINTVGDQLSPSEHLQLKASTSEWEKLQKFFWMWTLKEAYTKALGLGLGFDFRRVEFDVVEKVVKVDGTIPEGWQFNMFVISHEKEVYQGIVAERVGGIQTQVNFDENSDWLTMYNAVVFTEEAIDLLEEYST